MFNISHGIMKCGREFSSRQGLQYHLGRTSCFNKPTRCESCEKTYASHTGLRRHVCRPTCSYVYEEEAVCFDHGELIVRCGCRLDNDRDAQKKDLQNYLALFDTIEGVAWEYQNYWTAPCTRCKANRNTYHHLGKCLSGAL